MVLKKHEYKIKLIFGILVICLGFLVNFFSANYIHYKNLDCIEKNPDILLDQFTKPHPYFMLATEVIIVIALIIFLGLNYQDRESLINTMILFGLFNILRGFFLPLTIMGGLQSESLLSNYVTFDKGLFPSGHTALILAFLFNTKRYKALFIVLSLFVMAGLIISQQHYTIDILSSVLFIYAIKSFMEKHIK